MTRPPLPRPASRSTPCPIRELLRAFSNSEESLAAWVGTWSRGDSDPLTGAWQAATDGGAMLELLCLVHDCPPCDLPGAGDLHATVSFDSGEVLFYPLSALPHGAPGGTLCDQPSAEDVRRVHPPPPSIELVREAVRRRRGRSRSGVHEP